MTLELAKLMRSLVQRMLRNSKTPLAFRFADLPPTPSAVTYPVRRVRIRPQRIEIRRSVFDR